ncbi:hypothetical protein QJS66_14120 [Kocuria rhizophila]|nr:hypothetical protein QJS66_14120 [Kocuria rhizophila]
MTYATPPYQREYSWHSPPSGEDPSRTPRGRRAALPGTMISPQQLLADYGHPRLAADPRTATPTTLSSAGRAPHALRIIQPT